MIASVRSYAYGKAQINKYNISSGARTEYECYPQNDEKRDNIRDFLVRASDDEPENEVPAESDHHLVPAKNK